MISNTYKFRALAADAAALYVIESAGIFIMHARVPAMLRQLSLQEMVDERQQRRMSPGLPRSSSARFCFSRWWYGQSASSATDNAASLRRHDFRRRISSLIGQSRPFLRLMICGALRSNAFLSRAGQGMPELYDRFSREIFFAISFLCRPEEARFSLRHSHAPRRIIIWRAAHSEPPLIITPANAFHPRHIFTQNRHDTTGRLPPHGSYSCFLEEELRHKSVSAAWVTAFLSSQ